MIKVGILTSSRADYGIYKPLLRRMVEDSAFHVDIIAFGTHLSQYHGYTLDNIIADGFDVKYTVNSMLLSDDENSIASAIGLTTVKFSDFWKENNGNFDYVLCLGDRYEMFAAVVAGIPFEIKFAHIHGGETTLGAIDNIFRHSISLASVTHFTATDLFRERVLEIVGEDARVVTVGALSLDNIEDIDFLSVDEFKKRWRIDLTEPTILITLHPETVNFQKNEWYIREFIGALEKISDRYQIVITMPNADTYGTVFRKAFKKLEEKQSSSVFLIENFGTQHYFTCMRHAKLMLGNTSSGIIEAASFNKYVVNVGERQKGRLSGSNVIHVPFDKDQIIRAVDEISSSPIFEGENIYYHGGARDRIIEMLKRT